MMADSSISLKGIKKTWPKNHKLPPLWARERDNRIIKLLKSQKWWPCFPNTWGVCRGFGDMVSYKRPSTQSQYVGENIGSGGSSRNSWHCHHHNPGLQAEEMAENCLLSRWCQTSWGRMGRTVKDFWTSLDWPMNFLRVKRKRKEGMGRREY